MWAFIALSTLCSVGGQLTLKFAMGRIARAQDQRRPLILKMALSPWVIGGLGFYGLGVIFWLVALSHLDVSFVYPFASLSYVGIIIGSRYLFVEHISRVRLLGISFILFGVLLIGLSGGV